MMLYLVVPLTQNMPLTWGTASFDFGLRSYSLGEAGNLIKFQSSIIGMPTRPFSMWSDLAITPQKNKQMLVF